MAQRLFTILLSYCFLCPIPLFSWWETGHQAVARIAVFHLTAAARTRLARILDVPDTPEAVSDALAKASTWADETKSQTKTSAWHFIDLTLQDKESDIPARCPNDNCATARIRLFALELKSPTGEAQGSQLDALRYVVHFVGDIHQPLHTVSDADEGGNCELLDPAIEQAKNLHALWDGELVTSINPDDRALSADLEKEIESFGPGREHEIAAGNAATWTWESHELAIRDVYQPLHIPVEPVEFPSNCQQAPEAIRDLRLQIQQSYMEQMRPVVRSQLEKAGLRLARLLNESL